MTIDQKLQEITLMLQDADKRLQEARMVLGELKSMRMREFEQQQREERAERRAMYDDLQEVRT